MSYVLYLTVALDATTAEEAAAEADKYGFLTGVDSYAFIDNRPEFAKRGIAKLDEIMADLQTIPEPEIDLDV